MVGKVLGIIAAILMAAPAAAEIGEEPGWSITVISVADACGADASKVDAAAGYVAEWAKRNLADPSRLTKERALGFIKDNDDKKQILKEKGGVFIYPCSRWIRMLDIFVEAKGTVMDKNQDPAATAPAGTKEQIRAAEPAWTNREGKCLFYSDPEDVIDRVNISFERDGKAVLELRLSINAKTVAKLGPRQSNSCRFYEAIKGTIELDKERFTATGSGWTACAVNGDKIGAQTQFLDLIKVDGERTESVLRLLLANDTLPFKLTNGPKAGRTIPIPLKGLKAAIRQIGACPASVRAATE